MLVIRFLRVGKKGQPSFKIVVTDKRKPPRAGRFVEEVGFYNPLTKEKVLRQDRVKHWLSQGAKPSDTVYNLLVGEKVVEGKKISKHKIIKKAEEVAEQAPVEEVKTTAEAPVEAAVPEVAPVEEVVKEEKEAPAIEVPQEKSE